jgi:hypothetical protein
MTDTASLKFESSSSSNSKVSAVYLGGSAASSDEASNNSIGGITVKNTSTGTFEIRCIEMGSNTVTYNVQNNIIGGNQENSIYNQTGGTNTRTIGIYNSDILQTSRVIQYEISLLTAEPEQTRFFSLRNCK